MFTQRFFCDSGLWERSKFSEKTFCNVSLNYMHMFGNADLFSTFLIDGLDIRIPRNQVNVTPLSPNIFKDEIKKFDGNTDRNLHRVLSTMKEKNPNYFINKSLLVYQKLRYKSCLPTVIRFFTNP